MPMFRWRSAPSCVPHQSVCFSFRSLCVPAVSQVSVQPCLDVIADLSRFFRCEYESAVSWWTDRKCFGPLNMKPRPWANPSTILCVLLPGLFLLRFLPFVWFSFKLFDGSNGSLSNLFILKHLVCVMYIFIISNLNNNYCNTHASWKEFSWG